MTRFSQPGTTAPVPRPRRNLMWPNGLRGKFAPDRTGNTPMRGLPSPQGLYDPRYEHDACGVGFVCHIKGQASNKVVSDALLMLENMNHRGACGCEPDSGDGAGIMVRTPDKFFRKVARKLGIKLPPVRKYGVAMMFLPQEMVARVQCEKLFEKTVRDYGMVVLGWR